MKLNALKEIVASLENDLAENRSKIEAATEMADITNLKIEQRSLENEIKKYNAEIADYAETHNSNVRSISMSYDERPDFETRSQFKNAMQDAIKRAATTVEDIKLSIPEVYGEDLIVYMKDNCELLNEVTLTYETGDVVINRTTAVVKATWGAPGQETNLPEAQKFEIKEKVILSPYPLYAKMEISEFANIRSQFTFDNTFIELLGNAMIAEICPAIVNGGGDEEKMPLGIAVDPAVTTVIEVTEEDFSNPDFWIDYEDVIEDRYKVGTKLLMNRSSFSTLKKMKDSTGAYLGEYTLNHDGNKNYLLDKPVLKVDSTVLKSFAAAADGEVFAISGNFKHYRLNDASEAPIVRTYKDFNELKDVFVAARYIGGRVTVPYSFIKFVKKVG